MRLKLIIKFDLDFYEHLLRNQIEVKQFVQLKLIIEFDLYFYELFLTKPNKEAKQFVQHLLIDLVVIR